MENQPTTAELLKKIQELESRISDLEHERIAMLNNCPFPSWIKDIDGHYKYVNDSFLEHYNIAQEKILGKNVYSLYAEEYAKQDEQSDKLVLTEKHIHTYHIKRENEWFSVTHSPIFNSNGEIIGTTGFERNITDNIETLSSLRNEREFLQVLMDYIPYTIYFKDLDCRFTKINKAQAKLIGLSSPDEAVGKSDFDFFSAQHAQVAFDDEKRIMSTGIPLLEKVELIKDSDGKLHWVSATKIPVHDDKGNITGLVGMSIDITEKRQAEEKLREAKEKAEESDRLKTAFLANMSHEIRTPMNGIIGFSNLLRNPELTEEEREDFLNHITNCGSSLLNLIDDIIDISKIEAGQIKIRISESPINAILDEILESFLASQQREGKDHIKLIKSTSLPDKQVVIMTDPFRLRQIISNLIGNALKFTFEGSIEFGYNLKDKNTILFYVKDTGIGIPKDKQELIFERFGQVIDSNYYINQKGTGLGLAISSNLVKLLGGKMWVESNLGEGSTFFFSLPYRLVENPNLSGKSNESVNETINLTGKTILIAEDEETNYLYFKEVFKGTGATIIWVKNGIDAVEMVATKPQISLVLMDCKMPKMNGYDATVEIRKTNKTLPIIAQTAFAMSDEQEHSISAGCNAYISKPIKNNELFDLIKKYI